MRDEFFPCENPECDQGLVRTETGGWCTCSWCNGSEGEWREVEDDEWL